MITNLNNFVNESLVKSDFLHFLINNIYEGFCEYFVSFETLRF